jgi:hypothetical protein
MVPFALSVGRVTNGVSGETIEEKLCEANHRHLRIAQLQRSLRLLYPVLVFHRLDFLCVHVVSFIKVGTLVYFIFKNREHCLM